MGSQGALDWQNNGYKSTASAIAELVDNSIQANATKIDIVLIEKRNNQTERNFFNISDIYILDNGVGMNDNLFQIAFQFGGGNRFGARRGLGRYGMGLPNASVSQTRRFEAYTWQTISNKRRLLFNYLDLEEVVASGNPYLNEIQVCNQFDADILPLNELLSSSSGTVIKWVNVNNVRPKTVGGLIGHLKLKLGKMFRYYIVGDGVTQVEINILAFRRNHSDLVENLEMSVRKLKPYDPLFLMPNTQLAEICGNLDYNTPTSIEYAPTEEPFVFNEIDESGEIKRHEVKIRYSYMNPALKRSLGRNPGSTSIGKQYLYKGNDSAYQNISIVRGHREIDNGIFGFITDVSDNTNRFWSVEVQIEAISDEIFGIDNRKQSASKFRKIDSINDGYTEGDPFDKLVMQQLTESIIENIKELKILVDIGLENPDMPIDDPTNPRPGGSAPDEILVVDGTDDEPEPILEDENEVREKAKVWFTTRFPEYNQDEQLLEDVIDWFLKLDAGHFLIYSDLNDFELFSFKTYNDKTLIEVNKRHLFYQRLIREIESSDNTLGKHIIRYLFSALVNAEKKATNEQERRAVQTYRLNLALVLGDLIAKTIEDAQL